jgi:hypothetical protein
MNHKHNRKYLFKIKTDISDCYDDYYHDKYELIPFDNTYWGIDIITGGKITWDHIHLYCKSPMCILNEIYDKYGFYNCKCYKSDFDMDYSCDCYILRTDFPGGGYRHEYHSYDYMQGQMYCGYYYCKCLFDSNNSFVKMIIKYNMYNLFEKYTRNLIKHCYYLTNLMVNDNLNFFINYIKSNYYIYDLKYSCKDRDNTYSLNEINEKKRSVFEVAFKINAYDFAFKILQYSWYQQSYYNTKNDTLSYIIMCLYNIAYYINEDDISSKRFSLMLTYINKFISAGGNALINNINIEYYDDDEECNILSTPLKQAIYMKWIISSRKNYTECIHNLDMLIYRILYGNEKCNASIIHPSWTKYCCAHMHDVINYNIAIVAGYERRSFAIIANELGLGRARKN